MLLRPGNYRSNFFGQPTWVLLTVGSLFSYLLLGISTTPASAIEPSNISVLSSENITTEVVDNVLKVYLNTFRPNNVVSFKVIFHNSKALHIISDSVKTNIPPNSSLQFSLTSGAELSQLALASPLREIGDENGNPMVQIFPAPADFPQISYSGDTSLIKNQEILSTPVVTNGAYALVSSGDNIKFFQKSPNNLIGFRKLTDAKANPTFGGTPVYGYLEQKDFTVTATSPGIWHLLDSNYKLVARINEVKTKFGSYLPEGHGMATSPSGNPVVIMTVKRNVDSSWLKHSYKLPVLDCDIAEIQNGVAIREFSFWDWAVANKAVSAPLLNAMTIFNDPQNPTSSPIDICHANSMQFYQATNEYLFSLRSPSILLIVTADLKNVKAVLNTQSALQHFARFVSKTEITALGNFSLGKVSKFLDFKLINGKWQLKQTPFPVHVTYCGNTQYLDATHVWLGGGCGSFTGGVLGAIYKVSSGAMLQVGSVKMKGFNYSYRADLVSNG